jgi:hypothetical protein
LFWIPKYPVQTQYECQPQVTLHTSTTPQNSPFFSTCWHAGSHSQYSYLNHIIGFWQ